MDLMSNMGEYQTKDSPDRREHYTKMSPENNDSSRDEEMSSLPGGEWAVAESQIFEKRQKESDTWMTDISGPDHVSFLSSFLRWLYITL